MAYQRLILPALMAWYLALVTCHYVDRQPLGNDEQCVFNNIAQLKPAEIFSRPLLNDQEFPRLYLWTIQRFWSILPQDLLTLRFFAYAAMLGAFGVWMIIGRRVLGTLPQMLLFTGSWCASIPLVYYAAELKPYSTDVLISGLIVLFLLDQQKLQESPGKGVVLFFLLPWLGMWSYPAIFLLIIPLYNLIWSSCRQKRWLPYLTSFLAGYLLVLGLVYWFDARVSAHYLLEDFWRDYFISFHSLKSFFVTFGKGMNNLVGRVFAEDPKWIRVPSRFFMALGFSYMLLVFWGTWRRENYFLRSVVPIAFAVFIIQLALAMLRAYPLAVPRMTLFYFPMFILVAIQAMSALQDRFKVAGLILKTAFAVYLVYVSSGLAWDILIHKNLGAESKLYALTAPQALPASEGESRQPREGVFS